MKVIAIFSSNVPADYDMESPDFPFRRPGRRWKRCGLSATRSESAVSEKGMGRCGDCGPVVWPNGRIAVFSYDRLHIPHDGGSGVLFRAVKSTPNRPHATCSEPHFPALPEKAESLVNFLFTRLSALIFAVRRGLAPPYTHCFDFQGPFCEAHFGTPNWPLPVCVVFHNPFGLFSETEVWKFLLMCKNSKNNSNPVITYRADSWRYWNILLSN